MLLDVVAIGEMLVDIITAPNPHNMSWQFVGHPGGAPANVAIAMRRLGKQAGFCGVVSNDFLGDWLMRTLENEAVDCQFVHRCTQPTTLAFVRHTNGEGERSFSFYRENTSDILLDAASIPDALFAATRAIHLCSVSLSRNPARQATLSAIERAKKAGVFVSFDVNWRPMLWQNPKEGQELIRYVLGVADFVKMSEEDMELLEPSKDLGLLLSNIYGKQQPPLWIITRGSGTATCVYNGDVLSVNGYRVQAVDTTGAGDAFTGAFLSRLSSCQFAFPDKQSVLDAMRFAHAAAATCVTQNGAISSLPTQAQICDFLGSESDTDNQPDRKA